MGLCRNRDLRRSLLFDSRQLVVEDMAVRLAQIGYQRAQRDAVVLPGQSAHKVDHGQESACRVPAGRRHSQRRRLGQPVVGTLLGMGSERDLRSGDDAHIFCASPLLLPMLPSLPQAQGTAPLPAHRSLLSALHLLRRQLPPRRPPLLRLTVSGNPILTLRTPLQLRLLRLF